MHRYVGNLCLFHVPIPTLQLVIERGKSERSLRRMDKTKFLVPEEITISQLQAILRYEGHYKMSFGWKSNGFPILFSLPAMYWFDMAEAHTYAVAMGFTQEEVCSVIH